MKLLISFFLLLTSSCFGQETDKRGTIKIEKSPCVKFENNDSVYAFTDKMPEFPGGTDSLNKWMNINLKYPNTNGFESPAGTVFASFIVLKDGSLSDVKILKSNNKAFDKEALRLINLMPGWTPGSCGGTVVPVKVNYPIRFSLR